MSWWAPCKLATAPPKPDAGHTLCVCQAGEKLLLAEGSKLVMATFENSRAQGVYGLVTNLGSLVVRTLFQPIEEAAFLSFSKSGEGEAPAQDTLALVCPCMLKACAAADACQLQNFLYRVEILASDRWHAAFMQLQRSAKAPSSTAVP